MSHKQTAKEWWERQSDKYVWFQNHLRQLRASNRDALEAVFEFDLRVVYPLASWEIRRQNKKL
jgi:hypothetical protein